MASCQIFKGYGVTTGRQKGGHIRIKVTEPCYIMCICSITPRIDYGQGNTWDTYLKTMNDWHKPALDGIGYQDSLNGERAWWTDYIDKENILNKIHQVHREEPLFCSYILHCRLDLMIKLP